MQAQSKALKAPRLLLDSGAFSVATGKIPEFPVEEYGEYVIESGARAFNLDVIPTHGVSPEEASKGSIRNYRILLEMGATVIPVYHFGEPVSVLKEILAFDPPLISLGGFARKRTKNVIPFIRSAFEYLCDSRGRPRCKVHGLGLSAIPIIERFPFYSVDSSSFVLLGSAYATILVPLGNELVKAAFTEFKQTQESFSTFPKRTQDAIKGIIADRGFDFEAISTNWFARVEWNAVMQTERVLKHTPKPLSRLSLFGSAAAGGKEGKLPKKTLLYLVPSLGLEMHDMFSRREELRMLITYASIRQGSGQNFVDTFSKVRTQYA